MNVSDDFLLSGVIKLHNDAEVPIDRHRMAEILDGRMSEKTLSRNLDKLIAYGLVESDWEKDGNGEYKRVFVISDVFSLLVERICIGKLSGDSDFIRIRDALEARDAPVYDQIQ